MIKMSKNDNIVSDLTKKTGYIDKKMILFKMKLSNAEKRKGAKKWNCI